MHILNNLKFISILDSICGKNKKQEVKDLWHIWSI